MKHEKSLVFSLRAIAGMILLTGATAAFAAGPYTQIGTIAVPGGLSQFDIFWVDTSTDLAYLADDGSSKGAGAVDVFDVHADKFLYKIGLGSFVGLFDATHCCNGPTGVWPVTQQGELWAGNGNSTINVIGNGASIYRNEITQIINTGGKNRADEMAYDPKDHLMIIGNPSEPSVNFLTVINTDTHLIQGTINYPNSTGLEQPVWDSLAERFYVPIDGTTSEVDVIDPTQVKGTCTISTGPNCGVTSQVFVSSCAGISGMALLPNQQLMLSCGTVLQMPGGNIVQTYQTPSGGAISGDEIYYNPGDNSVYFGTAAPWIIDLTTKKVSSLSPSKPGSHVIMANPNNNHIYLPSPACGCIEVFGPVADYPAGFTPFVH